MAGHPTRLAIGAVAAGAGTLGWASLIERNAFVLRRHTVPCLPHGQRPLRILHLSDLHLLARQRRKAAWVNDLIGLRPDLVIATGDLIAEARAIPTVLDALCGLLAIPGAFVLGSNDYFAPKPKNPLRYLWSPSEADGEAPATLPTDDLVAGLTARGWLDLTNRRGELSADGRLVAVAGVDDPHLDRDDLSVTQTPANPLADLHLGVAHAPYQRVLNAMSDAGADLILAGHTHGGQVCVPFYGALVTNCDLDRGRASGLSRWGASWLHVSAGLGTSPWAPVRLACRPEASLLVLTEK